MTSSTLLKSHNINGCITSKLIVKYIDYIHMNSLSIEPVLFEKLYNIKLSHLVFRVTTFFQIDSTKFAPRFLLQCTHDLDKNLKALYSKLVSNDKYDHKAYDAKQQVLSHSALLLLCPYELSYCKLQITQLTSQVNNILPPSIS